ncbi:MAG TPA: hypothetical protein VFP71_11385 [Candidatus Angelobacter sp.]|nr:hypothetical protein [Candidatus Angelobacter sp.]
MKVFVKVIFILALASTLFAQQSTKVSDQPLKGEETHQPESFYKLSFAIYELEDGKRVNQRDYSMIAKANVNPSPRISISTRVPIFTEEKKMQYIDAGLTLNCNVVDQGAPKIQAHCEINMSGFVRPEQVPESRGNAVAPAPVMRSTNSNTWAVLTLGKPAVIASIDDINSAKRMQIEITATKVD